MRTWRSQAADGSVFALGASSPDDRREEAAALRLPHQHGSLVLVDDLNLVKEEVNIYCDNERLLVRETFKGELYCTILKLLN